MFSSTLVISFFILLMLSIFDAQSLNQNNSLLEVSSKYEVPFHTHVTEGVFGKRYDFKVNSSIDYTYQYLNASEWFYNRTARITVESISATKSFPVLVVVRQQKGVLSWQLPLSVGPHTHVYDEYKKVSRTLCPSIYYLFNGRESDVNEGETVSITISTSSQVDVTVTLSVILVDDFYISLSEKKNNITLSPSEPQFYGYLFPNHTDAVFLSVESEDELCSTVSIQSIDCPIFDLERNVKFEGQWETMTYKGGMTVKRESYPGGFYVVFVVNGDDKECTGNQGKKERNKTLSFAINQEIPMSYYLGAILGAPLFFLVICIFFGMWIYYRYRWCSKSDESCNCRNTGEETEPAEETEINNFEDSKSSKIPQQTHDEDDNDETDAEHGKDNFRRLSQSDESGDGRNTGEKTEPDIETEIDNFEDSTSSRSLHQIHDEDDNDETDTEHGKDIIRTTSPLYVCDLARKKHQDRKMKSDQYIWSLFTVGVFYALPVIQLVASHQTVLNQTGNLDMCYYNFHCAHPLGWLSDLNHLLSNIGYLLLGFLFIFVTLLREKLHQKQYLHDHQYGVPQHFGLFYTMGAALFFEGILSAAYHVCPSHSNFQFDTSFMYVISVMCMVKIYQNRHPDINARAYTTFAALAGVTFIGMWGVIGPSIYFWIIFTVLHVVTYLLMSAQMYYMTHWKIVLRNLRSLCFTECRHRSLASITPRFPHRMGFLIIANIINWGIAAAGIKINFVDFGTHLLIIFVINLILYCTFYIGMKKLNKERILKEPLVYIILSLITWGPALFFFFQKSISWDMSPAQSRTYNRPCLILGFYDNHDVWHFLSATSMFFSFMVLLTLDDDLVQTPRKKIIIF